MCRKEGNIFNEISNTITIYIDFSKHNFLCKFNGFFNICRK